MDQHGKEGRAGHPAALQRLAQIWLFGQELVEVVGGHVARTGYDYDAEFRFGLDVILDRLEQLLDQG